MKSPENLLPRLEAGISALNLAGNDIRTADDGLSDAKISALSSTEATVQDLLDLLEAIPWEDRHTPRKAFILSAIRDISGPIFAGAAVGAVTKVLADVGGSLADDAVYFIRVAAIDGSGKFGPASVEITQDVGSAGAGNVHLITLTIPHVEGATSFRIWFSTTTGDYSAGNYVDVDAAPSGNTTYIFDDEADWTADGVFVAAGDGAGYGFLTDSMIRLAAAEATLNRAFLVALVEAQHPLSPALLDFVAGEGIFAMDQSVFA